MGNPNVAQPNPDIVEITAESPVSGNLTEENMVQVKDETGNVIGEVYLDPTNGESWFRNAAGDGGTLDLKGPNHIQQTAPGYYVRGWQGPDMACISIGFKGDGRNLEYTIKRGKAAAEKTFARELMPAASGVLSPGTPLAITTKGRGVLLGDLYTDGTHVYFGRMRTDHVVSPNAGRNPIGFNNVPSECFYRPELVSGRHCDILVRRTPQFIHVTVTDLGSSNGTIVGPR